MREHNMEKCIKYLFLILVSLVLTVDFGILANTYVIDYRGFSFGHST